MCLYKVVVGLVLSRATKMAATSTSADKFIPSTKEYEVLQKYYGKLARVITNPPALAADLFSAELISEWTLIKATSENSSREMKCHRLLSELLSGVASYPTILDKIISVLQCHPPLLSAIAKEMKTDCGNGMLTMHN